MGLLGIDPQSALDDVQNRLLAPLHRFQSKAQRRADLIDAHNRVDFDTFSIIPYNRNGHELEESTVTLRTDTMPHQPFEYGGEQRLVKEFYPGNSEPTVQVLGARESDQTIKGRLKSKHIKFKTKAEKEEFRQFAYALQKQMDSIRIAGLLCRFEMRGGAGAWTRWGFIEKSKFMMRTVSDIDYELSFFIVGFNKPTDYIIAANAQGIPFKDSRELVKKLAEAQAAIFPPPSTITRSAAQQLNDAIGEIAEAINLVTGFVDTVLGEVDSLKASLERAKGLIKNARTKITQYQRRIGGINPEAGYTKTAGLGVSGAYKNATYLQASQKNVFNLLTLLAAMAAAIAAIAATVPLGRHRIQSGDTLQTIAVKWYNDSTKWTLIFDHNHLTTTVLTVGQVIEIPRG